MASKTKAGSLVSRIVQKASTYDQKVIDESLEKLSRNSAHVKGEIHELVKQQYVNFDSCVSTAVELEQKIREMKAEYNRIASRIEQDLSVRISQSRDKREEIEAKLEETLSRIALVQHLVDVHQAIETSRHEVQSGKFVSAAKRLSEAATNFAELEKKGCEAQVFGALKSELSMATSDLALQLQEKWQNFFKWVPKVFSNEPSLEVLSNVELHIPTFCTQQHDQREEVIAAMKLLPSTGTWERRVELFAQKLLQCVVKPLIVHTSLTASSTIQKGEIVVRVSKLSEAKETSISQLHDTLVNLFKALSHAVPREYQQEWLERLGKLVCPELEELIIAHRLSTSIPRSPSELAEYETVRAKTKEFEDEIVKIGMAKKGQMYKMSEYTDNVNVHFVSQKSQDMLAKARTILLQPLHNTVTVQDVDPFSKLEDIFPTTGSGGNQGVGGQDDYEISSLVFSFPKCAISESVQQFINHLYQTLEECASSTNPSAAAQLFHLARSMVDLFCAVVSSQQAGAGSELPRVAAVQHNNCMYLAHHLITLGHQFHSRLPPPLNAQTTTFIDQVPLVRSLGEDCFLAEMQKQSSCLLGFLKSFGTFGGVSTDYQRDIVRGALQKALLQTSKLSKVYLEVLPRDIHHKAVGGLLNVFMAEITRMILAMEDIAADDATEMHSVLGVVIEKSPQTLLLTTEETVSTPIAVYCKAWERLKGLAAVLDASLLEIVELWDSGKGTLASEFSVSEVRGLIKALFKNTERRAAALNKIK